MLEWIKWSLILKPLLSNFFEKRSYHLNQLEIDTHTPVLCDTIITIKVATFCLLFMGLEGTTTLSGTRNQHAHPLKFELIFQSMWKENWNRQVKGNGAKTWDDSTQLAWPPLLILFSTYYLLSRRSKVPLLPKQNYSQSNESSGSGHVTWFNASVHQALHHISQFCEKKTYGTSDESDPYLCACNKRTCSHFPPRAQYIITFPGKHSSIS